MESAEYATLSERLLALAPEEWQKRFHTKLEDPFQYNRMGILPDPMIRNDDWIERNLPAKYVAQIDGVEVSLEASVDVTFSGFNCLLVTGVVNQNGHDYKVITPTGNYSGSEVEQLFDKVHKAVSASK